MLSYISERLTAFSLWLGFWERQHSTEAATMVSLVSQLKSVWVLLSSAFAKCFSCVLKQILLLKSILEILQKKKKKIITITCKALLFKCFRFIFWFWFLMGCVILTFQVKYSKEPDNPTKCMWIFSFFCTF